MAERVRVLYQYERYDGMHEATFGSMRETLQRAWRDCTHAEAVVKRINRNGRVLLDNPYGRLDLRSELVKLAKRHRMKLPEEPTDDDLRAADEVMRAAREEIIANAPLRQPRPVNLWKPPIAIAPHAADEASRVPDGYECPRCRGRGGRREYWHGRWITCDLCDGSGSVFELLYGIPRELVTA